MVIIVKQMLENGSEFNTTTSKLFGLVLPRLLASQLLFLSTDTQAKQFYCGHARGGGGRTKQFYATKSYVHRRNLVAGRGGAGGVKCPLNIFQPKNSLFGYWIE
jgi:hypothetical protein